MMDLSVEVNRELSTAIVRDDVGRITFTYNSHGPNQTMETRSLSQKYSITGTVGLYVRCKNHSH